MLKKSRNSWSKIKMKMQHNNNLWGTLKPTQFITKSTYIKKSERLQINGLVMQLKNLEKQEQNKHKPSKWQEILKFRPEFKKTEIKKKRTTDSL